MSNDIFLIGSLKRPNLERNVGQFISSLFCIIVAFEKKWQAQLRNFGCTLYFIFWGGGKTLYVKEDYPITMTTATKGHLKIKGVGEGQF